MAGRLWRVLAVLIAPSLATLATVLAGVGVDRSGFSVSARPILALILVGPAGLGVGVGTAVALAGGLLPDSRWIRIPAVAAATLLAFVVQASLVRHFVTSWR